MKIEVSFNIDNAAYHLADGTYDPIAISRQLLSVAAQVRGGAEFGSIRDINGNTTGAWLMLEES